MQLVLLRLLLFLLAQPLLEGLDAVVLLALLEKLVESRFSDLIVGLY